MPPFEKAKLLDLIPFCHELGMSVTSVGIGFAEMRLPYNEKLIGDPENGVVHGGAVTALLDSVAGAAVMSSLKKISNIATLDLRIDYMKPANKGIDIFGYARCYKVTKSIAFVRGSAYHDDKDDPIATCAAAFMLQSSSGNMISAIEKSIQQSD